MSLTDRQRRQLDAVNLRVNHGVRAQADSVTFGRAERWAAAELGGAGDCEDLAIAKAQALAAAGVPVAALRLATCWTEAGEPHCVLTVDAADDTLVLDNRFDRVMSWAALTRRGYRWDRRQNADDDGWSLIA